MREKLQLWPFRPIMTDNRINVGPLKNKLFCLNAVEGVAVPRLDKDGFQISSIFLHVRGFLPDTFAIVTYMEITASVCKRRA